MISKSFKKYFSTLLSVIIVISLVVGCTSATPTLSPEMSPTPTLTPGVTENDTHKPTVIPQYPEGTPIYVSLDGSDENDGSKDAPFKSPEKAVEAVRELIANGLTEPVTVYFHAGEYKVTNITLTEADSGTADCPVIYKAFGDGEVVFNAGTKLKNIMFRSVEDESVLNRLDSSIQDKIKVVDLADAGLTLEDIGPLYVWGTDSTAKHYNDGTVGSNSEFFWNDYRMTLARWPNYSDGHARFDGVVDHGDKDNLIPGTMKLGEEALDRIKNWQSYESAGIFAYYMFDWADMATPIQSINTETGYIVGKHYSTYGYKDDAEYYFYNVLEELDAEGEYYIDRDNMLLYIYPPEGTENADALITTVEKRLVEGSVSNIRFDSITFKGSKSDIIVLTGDNISIINCKALNGYGNAISVDGSNNIIFGCEAAYMGKGGISINGGDRVTLTNGNSIIENCYIHHFEEVYRTYQPGIWVRGCGNKVISNEIAYAPHTALSYHGNEHEIAYNYIHDVVYESSDAGALYVGGEWTCYGVVIKYNLFRNIGGTEGKYPKAIYFDDGMSAGEIIGNIIENCSGYGINIGGGRDVKIKNNIVIGEHSPLYYDQRMSVLGWDTVQDLHWTKEGVENNRGLWSTLLNVPYQSELWAERYPNLASISKDINDIWSPDVPANPGYSEIEYNLFIGPKAKEEHWDIESLVYQLSKIGINYSLPSASIAFDKKTYTVSDAALSRYYMSKWQQIPYTEIGRYDAPITGRSE